MVPDTWYVPILSPPATTLTRPEELTITRAESEDEVSLNITPRPSLPVVASCSEREDELAGVTAESGAA